LIKGKNTIRQYGVEHQECKRIWCETPCHIWPGDDEPKELIKQQKKEEENEEDMLHLLFLTIVYMIEKKCKLPIGRIVQLKEYLDVVLIEMLKEIYTMRELIDAGICDDILLVIGGIEPNPGPKCSRCGDLYVNDLISGKCPRCSPAPYYGNVGPIYEEIVKKGIRCVSCFRFIMAGRIDYFVLHYALIDAKCCTCSKYYTVNRIPGQPLIVKFFFNQLRAVVLPDLELNQLIEQTPQWKKMQEEIPEDVLMEMKQIYSYIHPYVLFKMDSGVPCFTAISYSFSYNGCWFFKAKEAPLMEYQLSLIIELFQMQVILLNYVQMDELKNIMKDAMTRK